VREIFISWVEYRPNRNLGGEKFLRVGNFTGGSRKLDLILSYGGTSGSGNNAATERGTCDIFENASTFSFDFGDFGLGEVLPNWSDKLYHIEVRWKLATSTNSDGIFQMWVDGAQVASITNLRMFLASGDATQGFEVAELGGWSSTGVGSLSWATYPLDRWYPCGWKISSTRLGVWKE
jgi:hypothetical protein